MDNHQNAFGKIFDSLPYALIITKENGVPVFVNSEAYNLLSLPETSILKTTKNIRSILAKIYLKKNLSPTNEKLSTTLTIKKQSKKLQLEAHTIWVEFNKQKYLLITLRNVLTQEIIYQNLKIYFDVIKIFVDGHNLEDTLYRLVEIIGKGFNWECCLVWLANENNQLKYETSWCSPRIRNSEFINMSKNIVFLPGETLPGQVFAEKKPKWKADFSKFTQARRSSYAQMAGLKSVFGFPIKTDKEVYGVLEFFSSKKEFPNEEFYSLINNVNTHIGDYIHRLNRAETIRDREEMYRTLVELAPDIIYSLDSKGKVLSINEAYEKLTGRTKTDLIGQSLENIVHVSDRDLASYKIKKNKLRKYPKPFLARLNTLCEEDVVMGEFRQRTGNTIKDGNIGIIVDQTDRFNLEKQKDIWLGITAHELKTPITSIKAFAQLLLTRTLPDKEKYYLENINLLVDKMAELINEMLDITRINAKNFEITKSPTNMKAYVLEIITILQNTYRDRTISLQNECDCTIEIDKKRISQVISNLVSNAVKYSPKNKNIIIRTVKSDENFVFSVQDFGAGIPTADLSKIFGLFYRSGSRYRKPLSGLGLGLFICKKIISEHNGKIWAESKVGEGSSFYFTLPI